MCRHIWLYLRIFGAIARRSICGSVSFVCASSCDTICVTHLELFADGVAARCFFEPGVGIGVSGLSSGPFASASCRLVPEPEPLFLPPPLASEPLRSPPGVRGGCHPRPLKGTGGSSYLSTRCWMNCRSASSTICPSLPFQGPFAWPEAVPATTFRRSGRLSRAL